MPEQGNKSYKTTVIIVLLALCNVSMAVYWFRADNGLKRLKTEIAELEQEREAAMQVIDSLRTSADRFAAKADSLVAQLDSNQIKHRNEIKKIERRLHDFQDLSEDARDSLIRAFMRRNLWTED